MTPIDQLTKDLATAQAEIARLRDVLKIASGAMGNAKFLLAKYEPNHHWLSGFDRDFKKVNEALSQSYPPTNTKG